MLGGRIADCFGWDYVAVFSVDRRDNLFHIVYQSNRTNTPDVHYKYTQPLTEGLLGAALTDNAALVEPDIAAGSQFGYRPVVPDRRSALAFPIRVVQESPRPSRDEIEWMLSIKSSMKNAFQGPDMLALSDLLAQCEELLRVRWMKAVRLCLLDTVEQAVVIVDRAGHLRLTNGCSRPMPCSAGQRVRCLASALQLLEQMTLTAACSVRPPQLRRCV